MLKCPEGKRKSKVILKDFNFGHVMSLYEKVKKFIKNIPKEFIKAFFIVILSFFSVLAFVNREKFSPDYLGVLFEDMFAEIQHGKEYPYKISGNKVINENFKIIDKSLFLLSDTSLSTLNTSAKELQKKQHCYQNPMLKVSDTRAVIYDLGGKNLEVTSKSKTLHMKNMDDNIISAAVSNYGNFSVITETKGFLSSLTVFEKNGENMLYKYNFAEHYIIDTAIDESGKSVAACGSMAKEGSMVSTVYAFDYKSEEPKVKFNYDDNVFIHLEYLSNGNIVAVGDKLISVINPKKNIKEDYFYDNRNLIGFDVNKKNGILLALSMSEDGNNTDMIIINKEGKLEKSFHTDHSVKAVSFNNRKIAALSYGEVYIYNSSGKKLKSIDAGNDAQNIRLFSSRDIYVLGVNEVKKIRF